MRTNVVLNDALVEEAMRYSSAKSKSALIEEALRAFVTMRAEAARRLTYEERLYKLRRKLDVVELRERPSAVIARDRSRS
jgi:Arc/MetJ family transcription regulator